MTFKTSPQTQVEVEQLADALAALGPDQLLTYAEISAMLGYSVQERRWILLRAADLAEQQTGLRFGTVFREGICKLSAESLPGIGMGARRRIGRTAKRHGKRLAGLRYNDISREGRVRIDAERSLLGAIGVVASTKGNHASSLTKTGPAVATAVLDYCAKSPRAKKDPEQ